MESGAGNGNGAVDAEISRQIVKVYAELYGRGPSKVRTRRREELVICLLEDVFNRAERILVEAGHFDQIRANRQAIRTQIEPILRRVVERATGAPVAACIGQVTEAGLACEICLLATAPTPAALRDRAP